MAELVKIVGSEIALTTANTVGSAVAVRILNNSGGAALITRANSGTIGTVTLASNEVIYLQKASADTLASNVAVRAVAIAFN